MNSVEEIFNRETDEDCMCEDCGETKRLQFGVCIVCGGKVGMIYENA